MTSVSVRPVTADDGARVGRFLHAHLNAGVPPTAWAALVTPPWATGDEPHRGAQLLGPSGEVLGAYLVVHSTRDGDVAVSNLAAFCVLPEHRTHALRLVRAVLADKARLFTDLSPSGTVPALNERLGFRHLDTATRLVLNTALPVRGVLVSEDPAVIERHLTGRDALVYADHRRAPAARHVVVVSEDGYAYLVYRRDRRKRLPVFASPLFVGGSRAVLRSSWPSVSAHLARRGLPLTLAERRVLGFSPGGPGRELARPRPKMFRGGAGDGSDVDYLYSEMTLLSW